MNKFRFIVPALSFFLLLQSCVPVFSELQSARTVGRNRVEFTPSYSGVTSRNGPDIEDVESHWGMQATYGITESIDLKVRYEAILPKRDSATSIHVLGIGEKFSLVKDRLALSLSIGRALGEQYDDTWQMHPGILFTWPAIKDKLDINLSSRYLVRFSDPHNLLAFNFGFTISKKLHNWSIRPEYGVLYNPGNKGHYSHVSMGASFTLGKRETF